MNVPPDPTRPELPPDLPEADKEKPRPVPTGMYIALLIVGGLLCWLTIATLRVSSYGDENYQVGYLIGAMVFFPGTIMALFAISRKFRNIRSQATILLVMWSLSLLTGISRFSVESDKASDRRVITDAQSRIAELKQQLLETEDPREVARVQTEMSDLLKGMSDQLSPSEGQPMDVMNEFLQPLFQMLQDYTIKIAEYSESPLADNATIQSREDIQERLAILEGLAGEVEAVIQFYENVEDNLKDRLETSGLSRADVDSTMEGFNSGFRDKRTLVLKNQELELQMLQNMQSSLRYLDDHWDDWEVDDEGALNFSNGTYEGFIALSSEFEALAQEQGEVQQELLAAENR